MDKEVKWIKRNKHWNKHVGKKNTGLNIRTEATQNSEEKKQIGINEPPEQNKKETKWTPENNNKMEQENQNEHQKIKQKNKSKKRTETTTRKQKQNETKRTPKKQTKRQTNTRTKRTEETKHPNGPSSAPPESFLPAIFPILPLQ